MWMGEMWYTSQQGGRENSPVGNVQLQMTNISKLSEKTLYPTAQLHYKHISKVISSGLIPNIRQSLSS